MRGSIIRFSSDSRKKLAAKETAAEAALTHEQKEARKKAHEAEQERAEAALQSELKEQRAAEKIYAHVRGHHTRKHKGKRGGTRRRRGTRKTRGRS